MRPRTPHALSLLVTLSALTACDPAPQHGGPVDLDAFARRTTTTRPTPAPKTPALNKSADADPVASAQAAFFAYSGARLVFSRGGLVQGAYYEKMPQLDRARQLKAARIALAEVQRLPRGYLGRMGLKTIGIFAACASSKTDGYRPYLKAVGGYRYFGVWNPSGGVAAAYYTDEQLPLTLHHEIFHHVDHTGDGFATDDARFEAAHTLRRRYPALRLTAAERAALRRRAEGIVLEKTVSAYTAKSPGEDQAETARYLMSALPDALLQAADRPELPGSQRILHVLHEYAHAVPGGPDARWFIRVASR